MCVQNKQPQLSLLNYFCHSKHVCSNQAANCFLVYSATFNTKRVYSNQVRGCFFVYLISFVIRKVYVQNKGRLPFGLLIINKYYTPKMFLLRILLKLR